MKKKITILGAGIAGLTAAYFLSKQDYDITIIEKEERIGGLAKSIDFYGKTIPESYHALMPQEKEFLKFLKELKLDVYWTKPKMGFVYNNKIYKFRTLLDLLRFQPLTFINRLKFGIFSFNLFFANKNKLKKSTAKEWITKKAGTDIYNKIFKPLLKIKFEDDKNISAYWLYNRLILKQSRSKIGYIKDSLNQLIEALEANIKAKIITKTKIKFIDFNDEKVKITTVISTISLPQLIKISKNLPKELKQNLKKSRYESSISVIFETENKLTDFYWLNLMQETFLGAIINHSYLDSTTKNIYYTFTNLKNDSTLFKKDEKELEEIYKKEIKTILEPIFKKEIQIKNIKIIKSLDSKPIYFKNYLDYAPNTKSSLENLLLAGMCTYPKIRSMGNSYKSGKKAAKIISQLNNS